MEASDVVEQACQIPGQNRKEAELTDIFSLVCWNFLPMVGDFSDLISHFVQSVYLLILICQYDIKNHIHSSVGIRITVIPWLITLTFIFVSLSALHVHAAAVTDNRIIKFFFCCSPTLLGEYYKKFKSDEFKRRDLDIKYLVVEENIPCTQKVVRGICYYFVNNLIWIGNLDFLKRNISLISRQVLCLDKIPFLIFKLLWMIITGLDVPGMPDFMSQVLIVCILQVVLKFVGLIWYGLL